MHLDLDAVRRTFLRSLLAGAVTLSGCGQNGGSSVGHSGSEAGPHDTAKSPRSTKGTIGLSVLTLTNPFFKEIAEKMSEEARKHGYGVLVVSGEFDVAKQHNQVKDFIVKKVVAIALTPCDSKAIGAAIQEANQSGIPVFTADIACLAPGAKVVSHIATDNYSGGKEAGIAMIEALGESGGKIAILDHKVVESCILRVQGFKEAIESHNRNRAAGRIQIVTELPGGGVKDQAFRVTEDLLQAHPDLAGIFAINDPSALGARAALEKTGKANQVKIVGFDGQPEGKQAIKDGKIHADPIQFPDRIGAETVRAIVRHFAGESVPPQLLIPTALYRRGDAERDPTLR
ncbi:MAG: substrate-binding domain-containing protein [Verrucomicrobia bacterium]|nr:substrate-binding domain-containing protein [Verrucomicrobiota bacterium]